MQPRYCGQENQNSTSLQAVADGAATKSEELLHQEFILTYKSFTPAGPSCLPGL